MNKLKLSLIDLQHSKNNLKVGIIYNLILIATFIISFRLYGFLYAIIIVICMFFGVLPIDIWITAKRLGVDINLYLKCSNLLSTLTPRLYTYASKAFDKYIEIRGKYDKDFENIIERQLLYYISQLKDLSNENQIDENILNRITNNYNHSFMVLPSRKVRST